MKITVDRALCQGHGMCVLEAPDVFTLEPQAEQVQITDPAPDESQRAAVTAAVRYCPNAALTLAD